MIADSEGCLERRTPAVYESSLELSFVLELCDIRHVDCVSCLPIGEAVSQMQQGEEQSDLTQLHIV